LHNICVNASINVYKEITRVSQSQLNRQKPHVETATDTTSKQSLFFREEKNGNAHTAIERLPLRAHKMRKGVVSKSRHSASTVREFKRLKSFLNQAYGRLRER
jgi:hypothetical protein